MCCLALGIDSALPAIFRAYCEHMHCVQHCNNFGTLWLTLGDARCTAHINHAHFQPLDHVACTVALGNVNHSQGVSHIWVADS